jgi:polyisoprenoid-binding protein YceI
MKNIVAPNAQRIVLMLAITAIAAVPAIAKEGNWKLDADHSTARILLGANAFNIGVARVGGNVELDAAAPANSVLDLSIDPAQGKLITFKSRRATMSADGKLEVSGDLTLSRVVRQVFLNPAEDYSGPVYGEPMTQTVTREVTFVFPMSGQVKQAEITGEAKMFGEDFPELFAAVKDTNWQLVIQDKACEVPPAGEAYAGAVCTGTVVAPNRSATVTSSGEDYHGFESAAPEGNLMTIVLKLRLTRENPEQAMTARNLR